MKYYSISSEKEKLVFKDIRKKFLREQKPFVKFSYYMEKVIKILAAILALANIVYAVFIIKEPLYLLFLTLTFIVPLAFSLIFKAVYKGFSQTFKIDKIEELMGLLEQGIYYTYKENSDLQTEFKYEFFYDYKNITQIIHNKNLDLIQLYGQGLCIISENGTETEKNQSQELYFFNIFDVNILERFAEKGVLIKEN